MRLPTAYVKLVERWGESQDTAIEPLPDYAVVYPPVGFLRWSIGSLGNGDDYGYYWPVGREDADPLVALMSHDCRALNPIASSIEGLAQLRTCQDVSAFFRAGAAPENVDEEEPTDFSERLHLDERSPYLLVANGDIALGANDLDRAESLYLKAVEALPEYTAAHYGLVVLYRRRRQIAEAIQWMVEAIRLPLSFRGASFWSSTYLPTDQVNRHDYRRKCLVWLQQARPGQAATVASDPLFQARERLTFAYGVTTNDDYLIYDEAIERYIQQGQAVNAVKLALTYGELMEGETTPFQERYGFTIPGHRQRLLRLFRAANLESRTRFLEASPASSAQRG